MVFGFKKEESDIELAFKLVEDVGTANLAVLLKFDHAFELEIKRRK